MVVTVGGNRNPRVRPPTTTGDIAISVLVLVQLEHKMIGRKSLRKPH